MIKAIIFDCFGVLTSDLWREFVSTLPSKKQQPASDLNHALDGGYIKEQEFVSEIVKLTGENKETVKNIINADLDKNIYLLEYISSLKKKYKVGLISNISSNWITTELLNKDEVMLFDDILLSFNAGVTKPHSKIYLESARNLGVEPNECLFIDDSAINCHGAEEVGMQSILYKDNTQCKNEISKILANTNN